MNRSFLTGAFAMLAIVAPMHAADVRVANAAEFRAAVASAKPGTRILLAPGNYGAGHHFTNLRGEKGRPIVIAAADPKQRPVFSGGNVALHIGNPAHLELHDLVIEKTAQNGLNIDDGSANTAPESATGIALLRLHIRDIGGDGNHDGIKLSGIWDVRIADCTIERWGTRGGSAIDFVGCHRGVVEGNTISHNSPAPPNNSGVQCKGGTSKMVIRGNRFTNAGGRAVNIGGSTGLQFFRPPLAGNGPHAEARDIRVEGNTFRGSLSPVAFVGVDGAVVRFNTIENPDRWAVRILQETKADGFVPCRNGEFTDNTIVFDSGRWGGGGINVGGGADAASFKFARNWWYCADNPGRSRPNLPVAETEGNYGRPIAEAKGKAGADAAPKVEN